MSGLAAIEAQLRQHRNAYLAGAAGIVVLLALRARGRTAQNDTPVPTSYTTGNPAGPYDGTLSSAAAGAPVDLSPIQMQLAGLSQQITDYATMGMPPGGTSGGTATPSPVTAPDGATAGTVITAPAGRLPVTSSVPGEAPPAPSLSLIAGAPIWFRNPAPAPAPAAPKQTTAPAQPAPSTRALTTFDPKSAAQLKKGGTVTGGDGRTFALVGGVPTTIYYRRPGT